MKYLDSGIPQGKEDTHIDIIRCLSFNTSGTMIASGSDDRSIKIWDTKQMKLLFQIEGHSSVLSLAWTVEPHILVAGFEDGVIVTIIIADTFLETHSVRLRETQRRPDYPIEALSLNTRLHGAKTTKIRLATGGHQRVRVWDHREKKGASYQWSIGHELPSPFVNGVNDTKEVLVTGLEWLDETLLLASYMYHGLIIWDSIRNTTVSSIPVPSPIGRMALSPDGSNIAVSNFRNGVDIWDRFKNGLKQSCKASRVGRKFPLPVIFLHGGSAIASGDSEGQVSIWNVKSGMLKDELEHPEKSIHALASFSFHDHTTKEDRFILATAASYTVLNQHQVHLWKASLNSEAMSTRRSNRLRRSNVSEGGNGKCLTYSLGALAAGLVMGVMAVVFGRK